MIGKQIVTFASDGGVNLLPYEFPPGALIAGDPKPRLWSVTNVDDDGHRLVVGIFEADSGTIRNRVEALETIHVLSGKVRIQLDTQEAVDLRVSDIAVIPSGSMATWTFTGLYRELFVISGGAA